MWGPSWWDDEIFDDNNGFRNFSDIASTYKVFRITEFYENFQTFRNYFAFKEFALFGRSNNIII